MDLPDLGNRPRLLYSNLDHPSRVVPAPQSIWIKPLHFLKMWGNGHWIGNLNPALVNGVRLRKPKPDD